MTDVRRQMTDGGGAEVRCDQLHPRGLSEALSSRPVWTRRSGVPGAVAQGTSRGAEPVEIQPWVTMDYGPSLMATYEISNGDGSNIVNKGIAIRLDSGPGGVSRGRTWALYVPESGRSSGPSTMARTTTTNDRSRSRPPASRPTGTPFFSRSPTSGRPGAWRSCAASGAGEARRWTG